METFLKLQKQTDYTVHKLYFVSYVCKKKLFKDFMKENIHLLQPHTIECYDLNLRFT